MVWTSLDWRLLPAGSSCRGRCGIDYYRGYICQCDYGCLLYGECCKDYESHCTTRNSCKGRCGETFKRGRRCNCDSDCMKYKQCCPDYMMHCDAAEPTPESSPEPSPESVTGQSLTETTPWHHEPTQSDAESSTFYTINDSSDTNLCSGRPVGAVTTLKNGTMVVFRGHYFWFLDRNRSPGPARDITQVWGVPSPIDTVFTRCNCQGKTYIFKGAKYWRFENGALDPGYPKVVETGFDGLRGQVTAALSVPQYRRRRESVYFFKRGGQVQQYSYQSGTTPTCGRKVHNPLYRIRNARQAGATKTKLNLWIQSVYRLSLLGPVINIRTSWKSFPTTITAAVSVPSNSEPEGYKYYVFSRCKSASLNFFG
uniref:SMB domain-containing protein n=1 Tax=Cynoglossus semilaevis TaxID=244447 RepID=A0A3P8WJB1_CYNSE